MKLEIKYENDINLKGINLWNKILRLQLKIKLILK